MVTLQALAAAVAEQSARALKVEEAGKGGNSYVDNGPLILPLPDEGGGARAIGKNAIAGDARRFRPDISQFGCAIVKGLSLHFATGHEPANRTPFRGYLVLRTMSQLAIY